MHSALVEFRAALAQRNIVPPEEIIADGRIHRCDAEGGNGKNDAAYLLHLDGIPAGGFENWRDGQGWENWRAESQRKLTPGELQTLKSRAVEAASARAWEETQRRSEARKKAVAILEKASSVESHPYLLKKGIKAHGLKQSGGRLLVPVRDFDGTVHSLQFINFNGTDKSFLLGGLTKGCFATIGHSDDTLKTGTICVAEGWATAASIHEATGHIVLAALSAINMEAVSVALRSRFSTMRIVVCADDDAQKTGNPGKTAAIAAAKASGALLALPDFGELKRADLSDFNDLHRAKGLDAVRAAVASAEHPAVVAAEGPQLTEPSAVVPTTMQQTQHEGGLAYTFADELPDELCAADELVQNLLTRGAMGIAYGDSNSGKTFFCIDLACSVARGLPWMGRNVEKGLVVYLASESPQSVMLRLQAYQKHYNVRVRNFVIVQSPVNLYDGIADTTAVTALVKGIEARQGAKCELIIGDTLARLSAGANENSGEDMGTVVRNADQIRSECQAHFLLIHHSGKNAALGARGWSGLRAATDTEIEVTSDATTGLHAVEITKQRDIPGKGQRIGFRLQIVEMGLNKWNSPVTSCVLLPAEAPAKQSATRRPSEIAGAVVELLTSRKCGIRKRELVKHFEGRYASSAVYRELRKLIDESKLCEAAGVVALASPA